MKIHGRIQKGWGTWGADPLPGKSQEAIGFLRILVRTPSRTIGPFGHASAVSLTIFPVFKERF